MDPLRLLSRSTRISRSKTSGLPCNAQVTTNEDRIASATQPQDAGRITLAPSRKRKRLSWTDDLSLEGGRTISELPQGREREHGQGPGNTTIANSKQHGGDESVLGGEDIDAWSAEQRKHILKKHKVKVTWLNPVELSAKSSMKANNMSKKSKRARDALYPRPLHSFDALQTLYTTSPQLQRNIIDQGFTTPTEVQLAALPVLLDHPNTYISYGEGASNTLGEEIDLMTIAPTGSGKTLAFLMPLIHKIRLRKRHDAQDSRHTTAVVLAPTKELSSQIVNEGRKMAQNLGIQVTQIRKGMRLYSDHYATGSPNAPMDGTPAVKADIVVATPGVLQSILIETDGPSTLPNIRYLVLDEADVLLDPLFREQTLGIWDRLTNPHLRISLWSATMGSNVEELARKTLVERRKRLSQASGQQIYEAPLLRLVVGLKDSAVPTVQHKLIYAASEQGKLLGLRQLLRPDATTGQAGLPLRPPFLVFTQTIERAIALHAELSYDIPVEAGGARRIAVLHSGLSDTARDAVMTGFRKGEIWIIITTDLLSRGVDFHGINAVINYDIATSSAAYVHRIGRTGRAGREGGHAVTLYSKDDVPYLRHIANIVSAAQKRDGNENEGMDKWLLDSLPMLGKKEKAKLKKRGVESRTASSRQINPQAARKARISTKPGYVRREQNRRKSAILGSQRRRWGSDVAADIEDGSDFGGFE